MNAETVGSGPWSGVLAVADGALCYVGALSDARRHHHVATQVVRAWSGSFELADGNDNRIVTEAAIIPSGCDHSIRTIEPGVGGALVFVDPAAAIMSHVAELVAEGDDVRQWAEAGQAFDGWGEPSIADPRSILETISGMQPLNAEFG